MKKNNVFVERYLYSIIFAIVFLASWQFIVRIASIKEYILPAPTDILSEFLKNYRILIKHTWVTLFETLSGFFIGASVGFLLGVFIVSFKIIEKTIYPFVAGFQSVPKIAITPLLFIWFGFGFLPKIIATSLVAVFPVIVNTVRGLKSAETELIDLMNSLKASKKQILLKIRLPVSLPYLFSALKISITLSVVGAVVAEFVSSDRGLGYVIITGNVNLQTSLMFAAIIILSLMGGLLFYSIHLIEKSVLFWHVSVREGAS